MPMYEQIAEEFCKAIRKLASSENAINNFESYLSYHFPAWMEKYASYPEGLTSEFKAFSEMYD